MSAMTSAIRYEQESGWEVIHATKEKLQSFGIGAGLAFPGEGRAPKELRTFDPRGYETLIERGEDGCFQALIFYPRPEATHNGFVSPHIDGLEPAQDNGPYGDAYTGSAAAIVAAGIARLDQIPGQAGAAKAQVCILPDGSIPKARSDHRRDEPGAVLIKRNGKSVYRIFIRTTKLEMKRRAKIQHDAYLFDQYQQSRMPPTAILLAVHRELKRSAAVDHDAQAPDNLHNGFCLRTAEEA
jgi:hypothetical protein